MRSNGWLFVAVVSSIALSAGPARAMQQTTASVVTEDDYARAESFLSRYTTPYVYRNRVSPNWMDDGRMWYANSITEGTEFVVVDPRAGTRRPAFDHARLASALSSGETTYEAYSLPFSSFEFTGGGRSIVFSVGSDRYTCSIRNYTCEVAEGEGEASGGPGGRFGGRFGRGSTVTSPDGKLEAFTRDNNLWVRDTDTSEERQLTFDGIEDFGYATNNAGWTKSDRPVLEWSPDSKKIATFQHDGRGVGEMYLYTTTSGHPELSAWKYPLPGDSLIFRIERVVVDVDGPKVVRLQMPPDAHRSTISDHVAFQGGWADIQWSEDSNQLIFVSTSRDHKDEVVRVADPETGAVRDVMSEHADTFFESGYSDENWMALPKSSELIWWSQRSNWGHLYLYDLATGALKHQITSGDWNVYDILDVNEDTRTITFLGIGREPGDPYFQYLYTIKMDGSGLKLLTPENGTHSVSFSPDRKYFVDQWSTPDTPPITVLRDMSGRKLVDLEEADISKLIERGWQPPIPIKVKARDGETDIYGLMYKPTNFDPSKKYPILNYLYPGPQTGSVGGRSFSPSRSDKQAVAELGFIVVEVDAMGTPMRSKKFHEAYYGNMGDNGLPDQVTAIKQLAAENPWMDIDRVGIWGHSGGGFASTAGILRYPDFYKVAVSGAGNHDNATYEDDWGEKWQGLLERYDDGTTNYDNQANYLLADNLKGNLLIAAGTMDNNVPPNNTLLMVDALVKANKDFDLLMFPNGNHGFGNPGSQYWMRRRWDYFVTHLLHKTPPKEYEFGHLEDRMEIGQPSG
jgi:dipeptidyl aminopeptidase/acylaminoacyl peptidase